MPNTEYRSRVVTQVAASAVPESVDVWPALHEQLRSAQRVQARRSGLLAAAAAFVVVLAVAGLPLWNTAESVSAETILDRAESAASIGATVSTYHLVMTRSSKGGGTTASEIWFGGPDKQRTIQQISGPNGSIELKQDVVFNGPETWIQTSDNGVTRAIHTIGTNWTRPAESPSDQPNIAELLRSFGDKTCMSARLEQTRAIVAGQETYVIIAMPSISGCAPSAAAAAVQPSPGPGSSQSVIRVNGQPAGSLVSEANEVTVWVDKRSFLPLKMEVRDAHGVVLDRSEVTVVEYNVSIPDATFAYTPPPGVAVSTFSGGSGADVKRILASEAASVGAPPRKAP